MMDDDEDDEGVGPALSIHYLSDLKCIISIPRSAKALLSVNCRQLSIPPCKPQIIMIIIMIKINIMIIVLDRYRWHRMFLRYGGCPSANVESALCKVHLDDWSAQVGKPDHLTVSS